MLTLKNSYRELSFADLYEILDENLYVDGSELRRKVKSSHGMKKDAAVGSRFPVGYWVVSVFARGLFVRAYRHQVIFILTRKEDPRGQKIDHLNGVRGDDRAENLRILSSSGNSFSRHRTSTAHGLIGVHFRARRWEVSVVEAGKSVFRRRFEFAVDACAFYWGYREARDPEGVAVTGGLRASQEALARSLDEQGITKRRKTLTGVPGVTMLRGKFYAQTNLAGKKVHLGTFTDLEEARAAFAEGRTRLGLTKEIQWQS
jgi:hypothetical protein